MPQSIIKAFRLASQIATQQLSKLSVSLEGKPEEEKKALLEKCAMTTLNSKLVSCSRLGGAAGGGGRRGRAALQAGGLGERALERSHRQGVKSRTPCSGERKRVGDAGRNQQHDRTCCPGVRTRDRHPQPPACLPACVCPQQVSGEKEFFAKMVVDAVSTLDPQTLDLRMIGIKKVTGGGLRDSFLVDGVAFKKTFSYAGFEQQPKSFSNPKILLLNIELELKAEKENAEVQCGFVLSQEGGGFRRGGREGVPRWGAAGTHLGGDVWVGEG